MSERNTVFLAFQEAQQVLREFLANEQAFGLLEVTADLLSSLFKRRGRVLIAGNGGSHADALHFAEELTGKFRETREPYAALALGEATHATCVSNDFGFEQIFARQIEAFGHERDILILLTTSGNSANLIVAEEAAHRQKMTVVAFTGKGGGKLAQRADLWIDFPGTTSDRIQELQMLALHALVEAVEARRDLV